MSDVDAPRTPTLADLFLRMARSSSANSQHCLPAVVTRFDAAKQAVDAQPTIEQERQGEDGIVITETLPQVLNAPIMFYGSGDYRDTMPIAVGSVVILWFTSASLERWLTLGGRVAPRDARRHTLSDAVAYPGGHSFAGPTKPATSVPSDARCFHGPRFKFDPDAAKTPATLEDLQDLKAFLMSRWVPAPMDGGASLSVQIDGPNGWHPTGSPRIKVP